MPSKNFDAVLEAAFEPLVAAAAVNLRALLQLADQALHSINNDRAVEIALVVRAAAESLGQYLTGNFGPR